MSSDIDLRMVAAAEASVAAAEASATATFQLRNLGIVALIVTIITFIISAYIMYQQMDRALSATRLELRPYLNIKHESYSGTYDFRSYRDDGSTDTIVWEIRDLELGGAEYMGVQDFRYQLDRKIQLDNSGATPLQVTRYITSTLSDTEWREQYHGDPAVLEIALHSFSEWETARQNHPIIPGQSDTIVNSVTRSMAVQEFEGHLEEGELNLFPYTFVEYEDCFGQVHSTLLVERLTFTLEESEMFLQKPEPIYRSIEEYCWSTYK